MTLSRASAADQIPKKVRALVALAESHGWIAKAAPADVFRGVRDPWYRAAHFVATREVETITLTWIDGVAVGPIGWYIYDGIASPIKNRANATRLIAN